MHKNILIILIIQLFINKLKAVKCNWGTETNLEGIDDNLGNRANCVNCKANYYFSGANFIPGVSLCERCPISKFQDARANDGNIATLAVQCDINCPTGTQTEQGNTTYVLLRNECNFCKANYYYESFIINFTGGVDKCNKCPVQKASGFEATLGSNAKLAIQCDVTCPTGTTTKTGSTSYVSHKNECVNCNADFYFDSFYFYAGISTCKPCPVKKTSGAIHTEGLNAQIYIQCDAECPFGTVIYDGKTTYFKNDKSECVKCATNFYTIKQNGWIAGTDTCIPCPNILILSGKANYPFSATYAAQCKIVFSQFLTFSLLLIYLYFL
ncbi:immobilization antigen isoform, putative [Ichthyophthirius multifiliis]|uniref:Immobilization antigen isoform, putative n=1 Tax=Ichthyophthirius multifiliis TaxID=5932 RepID=G0QT86_ICHMU|nr:immobilization antigen isoform, putative [Ichthyophthirius multifiliis]EGR31570.1 immobilization antigen isoform, putative [Ichthyophthirius multifiliis]|eukprot:XP_004035056.1 immobilization antigen isoform, putative [Ichthyophthirius multifiliis]